MAVNYFAEVKDDRSALVHHPTGAGKSGIMATIARMRATDRPVLVICPSAALVVQLEDQFRSTFWDRIGADPEWRFERTARLTISRIDDVISLIESALAEPVAVFATIQALQQIHASDADYERLRGRFGTILFDEGHREPAPQWAKTARGLGAMTILFSATPYRNDLKVFGVDQDHSNFLSFQFAQDEGIIRPVEVREEALAPDPKGFIDQVVSIHAELLAHGHVDPGDKVIIRAGTESEVEALFIALRERLGETGEGALAIHNNFTHDHDGAFLKIGEVPEALSRRTERFLIHQHMLTEGIDDPACRMLALFSNFTNERQLVQQVGRVTRHPGPLGEVAGPAYVLGRLGDGVGTMWERFLSYDKYCVDNDGRPPLRDHDFVRRILAALPQVDYVDGQFRRRAELGDEAISSDIRVPRSAVIFGTKEDFAIDAFESAVGSALNDEDRIEMTGGAIAASAGRFHLSVALKQSPLLAETLFQTASVEITAYVHRGDRLFFYDSGGLWMDDAPGLGTRLDPKRLASLLPEDGKAITSVTLRNTDLGPISLRGRSYNASSVARAGVFVGEHTHVVTRATGSPASRVRRSLGFTSARVREGEGPAATLQEFSDWTAKVGAELDKAAPPSVLFSRFAAPIDTPLVTEPRNILVDLYEYGGQYRNARHEMAQFDLESACSDVTARNGGPKGYTLAFDLRIDEDDVVVWIRWDAKKQKYWLSARELTQIYDDANPKVTLLHRLNRQQPFRIILSPTVIYAYGRFYSVDLKLGRQGGPASLVLGLLHGIRGLDKVTSEKGELTSAAMTWPQGSLFGVIDRALASGSASPVFGPGFQALVCDDIGNTEVADFIGVDDQATQRVVFIPAKWKKGKPGAGASGLYDVSGQALKNLAYLKADGQPLPGASRRFDNPWTLNGGKVDRRRTGPGSLAFRALFEKVRANPAASREVWIVLGGGILSKKQVGTELAADAPPSHVLQLVHLLLSLYAGCQSIGVDLKIYCSE